MPSLMAIEGKHIRTGHSNNYVVIRLSKNLKDNIYIIYIMSKSTFSEKYSYAHYLSYAALVGHLAILGAVLWQFPMSSIFGGLYKFLSLMSGQEFLSAQNSWKISLHGYCHGTAPTMAT